MYLMVREAFCCCGGLQHRHLMVCVCVAEFIPCMDKLFDESILIGSGYTARETLR